MTINELIEQLQKYDGDQQVYVWDDIRSVNAPIKEVSLYLTNKDIPQSEDNPLSISF